ncbi:hypothetical protein COP2_020303 [Malus domestica]
MSLHDQRIVVRVDDTSFFLRVETYWIPVRFLILASPNVFHVKHLMAMSQSSFTVFHGPIRRFRHGCAAAYGVYHIHLALVTVIPWRVKNELINFSFTCQSFDMITEDDALLAVMAIILVVAAKHARVLRGLVIWLPWLWL